MQHRTSPPTNDPTAAPLTLRLERSDQNLPRDDSGGSPSPPEGGVEFRRVPVVRQRKEWERLLPTDTNTHTQVTVLLDGNNNHRLVGSALAGGTDVRTLLLHVESFRASGDLDSSLRYLEIAEGQLKTQVLRRSGGNLGSGSTMGSSPPSPSTPPSTGSEATLVTASKFQRGITMLFFDPAKSKTLFSEIVERHTEVARVLSDVNINFLQDDPRLTRINRHISITHMAEAYLSLALFLESDFTLALQACRNACDYFDGVPHLKLVQSACYRGVGDSERAVECEYDYISTWRSVSDVERYHRNTQWTSFSRMAERVLGPAACAIGSTAWHPLLRSSSAPTWDSVPGAPRISGGRRSDFGGPGLPAPLSLPRGSGARGTSSQMALPDTPTPLAGPTGVAHGRGFRFHAVSPLSMVPVITSMDFSEQRRFHVVGDQYSPFSPAEPVTPPSSTSVRNATPNAMAPMSLPGPVLGPVVEDNECGSDLDGAETDFFLPTPSYPLPMPLAATTGSCIGSMDSFVGCLGDIEDVESGDDADGARKGGGGFDLGGRLAFALPRFRSGSISSLLPAAPPVAQAVQNFSTGTGSCASDYYTETGSGCEATPCRESLMMGVYHTQRSHKSGDDSGSGSSGNQKRIRRATTGSHPHLPAGSLMLGQLSPVSGFSTSCQSGTSDSTTSSASSPKSYNSPSTTVTNTTSHHVENSESTLTRESVIGLYQDYRFSDSLPDPPQAIITSPSFLHSAPRPLSLPRTHHPPSSSRER